MYRTICSVLLVMLIGGKTLQAQNTHFDQLFTFAWDVNIPMGDKYVEDVSYAGGKLEFQKMVNENWAVGIDVSWNSYYTYKYYQTYHLNGGTDITTDLFKYNYTLPLALTAKYYFPSGGLIQPFAGVGLGATFSAPKLYANIYEFHDENWGFLVRPEVGAIIKFQHDSDMGILLGARYSYSTNSADFFHIDNLQALGFQLGLIWTY